MTCFFLLIMPKRRTFGHCLASSEDNFFLVKKEDMSSKRRTYNKPIINPRFVRKNKVLLVLGKLHKNAAGTVTPIGR